MSAILGLQAKHSHSLVLSKWGSSHKSAVKIQNGKLGVTFHNLEGQGKPNRCTNHHHTLFLRFRGLEEVAYQELSMAAVCYTGI